MLTNPPTPPSPVNLTVTNLSPAGARFLRELVALFCDPSRAPDLNRLRNGQASIDYGPHGECWVHYKFGVN